MNTSSKIDLKSRFFHDAQLHIIKILPTLKAISASCDLILMNLKLSIFCICLFWFEVSMISVLLLIFVQIFYYMKIDFEASWVTLISYILTHKFLTIF